ncbi:MAG: hypothetical protein JXR19_03545 [Bacteroidia bacterium]
MKNKIQFIPKTICLFLLIASINTAYSQDFYGANFTGKYTYGVNISYDGDLWAGVNANYRNFGNFGGRALDYNLNAAVKLDNGISKTRVDFGLAQLYSDNTQIGGRFGLGARYGIGTEFCTSSRDARNSNSRIDLTISLRPGYFNQSAAFTGVIDITPLSYNFGCGGYSDADPKPMPRLEFNPLDRFQVGAHYDFTTADAFNNGRYHLTTDLRYLVPIGTNENDCDPADSDISIRMSHSMRF